MIDISDDRSVQQARINERIRASSVRVIAADGRQLGILPIGEALEHARQAELDLVEVAAQADPPVCRIMNYGKFRYEQAVKQKAARRKSGHRTELKEMRLSPIIAERDLQTKLRRVEQFLEQGYRVRAYVRFRGYQNTHPELGRKLLERVAVELGTVAVLDGPIRHEGRTMTVLLRPKAGAK